MSSTRMRACLYPADIDKGFVPWEAGLYIAFIYDSSSEHVARASRKIGLLGEKNIRIVIALDLIKCLKQIKYVRTYF